MYVDDPNHVKKSTAGNYHQSFNSHLTPHFGDHWLESITTEEVQRFVGVLGKQGLAPKTIRNILVPMKTMFKHAIKWGYLKLSPMPDVDLPKIQKKEMVSLSPDEIRRFLPEVPEKWYPFFLTATLTGMRLGELVAMKWANLDLENGRYRVRERYYRGDFDVPKSPASLRSIDLPQEVVDGLRSHRRAQNEQKLRKGAAYQDSDIIFARTDGKHYVGADQIRKVFTDALTRADCAVIRLHDLRHTYASLLISQNESPKYIQKQLGHSSIQTTFDIYGHLMDDAGAEAMVRLNSQVFGA